MNGVKRSLQTACGPEFTFTTGNKNDLSNWEGLDNGATTTLSSYCVDHNCCGQGASSGTNACRDWNSSSSYEICPNSCNGDNSCRNIASSSNTSTISIETGACNGVDSCTGIAQFAADGSTVKVETLACQGVNACTNIKGDSNVVANVLVEASQCITANACENCGSDSTFTGVFNADPVCCDVVQGETNGNFLDIACNEALSGEYKKN